MLLMDCGSYILLYIEPAFIAIRWSALQGLRFTPMKPRRNGCIKVYCFLKTPNTLVPRIHVWPFEEFLNYCLVSYIEIPPFACKGIGLIVSNSLHWLYWTGVAWPQSSLHNLRENKNFGSYAWKRFTSDVIIVPFSTTRLEFRSSDLGHILTGSEDDVALLAKKLINVIYLWRHYLLVYSCWSFRVFLLIYCCPVCRIREWIHVFLKCSSFYIAWNIWPTITAGPGKLVEWFGSGSLG